jgi:hypothetical protein
VIFNFFKARQTGDTVQLKCWAISDKYASGLASTKALSSSGGNFFGLRWRFFGSNDSFAFVLLTHSFIVVLLMPNRFAVAS